ncbi:MAG TPA: hypothetical protein VMH30_11240 [Verrucomicrobiae bacterium]|nr:hypothetical protein [Verrucomicrobiae bacterium]
MKQLIAILVILALAAFVRAPAQNSAQVVSVEITLDQSQFLPAEALPVTVHVFNLSGQTLHLGATPDWLTFSVQSLDNNNSDVVRNSQPPVTGAFDLGSSDVAIKHVDIAPYFNLKETGRYRVTAFVHIPEWNTDISSQPVEFDIIDGAELWSQAFGVPMAAGMSNGPPEVRKYVLEEANYLRRQLRLYLLVTDDTGGRVFKVSAIGPMVSFSRPEAELDSDSNLHVLYQSGAESFLYSVINPDGNITQQAVYDYSTTRPELSLDAAGHIVVVGGVRWVKPAELPIILPPNQVGGPSNSP